MRNITTFIVILLIFIFISKYIMDEEEQQQDKPKKGEREWKFFINLLKDSDNQLFQEFAQTLEDNMFKWRTFQRCSLAEYQMLHPRLTKPLGRIVQDLLLDVKARFGDTKGGEIECGDTKVPLSDYDDRKPHNKIEARNRVCYIYIYLRIFA